MTQSEVVDYSLDDEDDDILDAYMTNLEKNDGSVDVNVGNGHGGNEDGSDGNGDDFSGSDGSDDNVELYDSGDDGRSGAYGIGGDIGSDEDLNLEYESENEDILLYEDDSEDGIRRRRVANPKFNPKVTSEESIFELGMEFTDLKEFKNAVKSYAVDGGYQIQLARNEKTRCQAKCNEGCPWMIWCSQIKGESTFQIKTYVKRHMCNRRLENRQADSTWLSMRLVDKIRGEPKISAADLVTYAKEHMSLAISRTHAYRAKKKALEIIEGKHKEQYGKLRSYMSEVLRTNIGSTCNLLANRDRPEDPAVFKRVYICLAPLKSGFLAGCRPLIGLDGCFLKTIYGGQLLTAVAHDGANGIFPIAWAVVERENGDSWEWFLRKLLLDIGGFDRRR
ncbi:uncharacterized protein LOC120013413 [Tripterygium wilfordii]|uniref:uncharacterized protein LOC120013413 n=1 Tax=Tripterygium wilfordii TaxID=458696 RepID=UPI0018F860C5|nr:uncharacterized protein LOC120013413 [Tripterygium wilfordii]